MPIDRGFLSQRGESLGDVRCAGCETGGLHLLELRARARPQRHPRGGQRARGHLPDLEQADLPGREEADESLVLRGQPSAGREEGTAFETGKNTLAFISDCFAKSEFICSEYLPKRTCF